MTDPATILVVDDEFAIVDLLEEVLTEEGYRVLKAGNGRQALERLAEGPRPDVVISDFMMPVLDGVGLIEGMRRIDSQRDIPCIVISSMPEATVRERIDSLAAFLRKPFRLSAVVSLVEAVLGASRVKS